MKRAAPILYHRGLLEVRRRPCVIFLPGALAETGAATVGLQAQRSKGVRVRLTSTTIRPDGSVIQEIDPMELKERLDRGDPIQLVDVRERFERLLADLPDVGQRRIPVKEIPVLGRELDRDRDIVLYCRSGPRSAWATERLMEMGFQRVFNLKGGVLGWRDRVDPATESY